MTLLKGHEQQAIKTLVGDKLPVETLNEILDSRDCQFDYSGAGYFISIRNDKLPTKRTVFNKPLLLGKSPEGIESGYVVFVENSELTLECHPFGDNLSEDFREKRIVISLAQ